MHAVFTKKINEKILQVHSKSYNPFLKYFLDINTFFCKFLGPPYKQYEVIFYTNIEYWISKCALNFLENIQK